MKAAQRPAAKGAPVEDKHKVARESAIDLSRLLGARVHVELHGGRQVSGVLRGHDALTNLVLDDTTEVISVSGRELKRSLGFVVLRGTQVSMVAPSVGMTPIANPFPAL